MPTYVYQKKDGEKGCPHCSGRFEVDQSMSDEPLKKCPKCGAGVRRVISAPNIVQSDKSLLSDKNLKAHGFERLVKEEKGKYRKTT